MMIHTCQGRRGGKGGVARTLEQLLKSIDARFNAEQQERLRPVDRVCGRQASDICGSGLI
jgi:hypothetical protein